MPNLFENIIRLVDIDKIGELRQQWSEPNPYRTSDLIPCLFKQYSHDTFFKNEIKLSGIEYNLRYDTGYLFQEKFYKCPIIIGKVILSEIVETRNPEGAISYLVIPAEGYRNGIMIDTKYKKYDSVLGLINVINVYLNRGNSPERLLTSIESGTNSTYKYRESGNPCLYFYQQLKFESYQNGYPHNNIGKDNEFWTEVVIYNILNDVYMQNLLIRSIKNIFRKSGDIQVENGKLSFDTDHHSGYSPPIKEKIGPNPISKDSPLCLTIFSEMVKEYDSFEESFTSIVKNM